MRGRPERRLASAHRLVLVNLSAVLILRWAASPVGPDLGFVIVEPGDPAGPLPAATMVRAADRQPFRVCASLQGSGLRLRTWCRAVRGDHDRWEFSGRSGFNRPWCGTGTRGRARAEARP